MEGNKCIGENCGKPAKLQCPQCLKLKVKGSFFCSQDCFKSNWNVHKMVHLNHPGKLKISSFILLDINYIL
jgi:methionyl aminopeptidase